MIMTKYIATKETFDKLEDFSTKMESLKIMTQITQNHIWQDVMEAENDDARRDAAFKVAILLGTILEIVEKRDVEIDEIISEFASE